MNERERLIELLKNAKKYATNTMLHFDIDEIIDTSYDDLVVDYLLKDNVVALPCKIGEKIFEIIKDCFSCSHYKEDGFCFCGRKPTDELFDLFEVDWDKDCVYAISETHFNYNMVPEMGETVFLTREEAEKTLKEIYKDE